MSIAAFLTERNIQEVLHFTTCNGLTGVLATGLLKSRTRLSRDQYLSYILKLNTPRVLDHDWEDFVNLSIGRINSSLFEFSNNIWHPGQEWRILSFSSDILNHSGVWFSTTNNAYHQHTIRGQGKEGLQKLFDPVILGRYGVPTRRATDLPSCYPTCPQAEVLYPCEISTQYLQRVYVKNSVDHDSVGGQLYLSNHQHVTVIIDPKKFG
jgi:hypothetical protein